MDKFKPISEEERSDENSYNYSSDDWHQEKSMCCPYMHSCPMMYAMMNYGEVEINREYEYDFEDEYEDEDEMRSPRPMPKPPYHPYHHPYYWYPWHPYHKYPKKYPKYPKYGRPPYMHEGEEKPPRPKPY